MDLQEKLNLAEKKLASCEQTLRSISRLFPDPIFVFDRGGKCLEVNGGNEWSLYRSSGFLTGKFLHDLLPPDLADEILQAIAEALRQKSLITVDYLLEAKDIPGAAPDSPKGSQWFEAYLYPLYRDNHEPEAVVMLPVNMTRIKKLEDQVSDLSARDTLTKAYNRRYFMQIFEKEFSIAKRYKNRLSILHIAIDRLNEVNDTYGQGAGDAILKKFTVFCESILRSSDLFARYGGAGFIVMLPNTPSLGAAIIAERLRAHAEELDIVHEQATIQFTISMGISEVSDSDASTNAVLARADSALYRAKKGGRNRIEIN